MEISVGEYVRTDKGNIAKIKEVRLGKHKSLDEFINIYILDNEEWTTDKYILKHSKNIIDLIEEGDYVNGSKVIDIAQGKTKAAYIESQEQKFALIPIVEKQIKSIVTKEQIKQIEYRIKE